MTDRVFDFPWQTNHRFEQDIQFPNGIMCSIPGRIYSRERHWCKRCGQEGFLDHARAFDPVPRNLGWMYRQCPVPLTTGEALRRALGRLG